MRKSILLAAVFVACAGTATAVDTWYWTRAVTCNEYKGVEKGYYGYTSQSAANFTNAVTGVAGLPVSGDFLLVRSAGGFGQDFGTGLAFGGVTVTANSSVEFVSQGTLTMQAGGAGLVFSNNVTGVGTANGSIAFTGSGEAIVDVQNANQSFLIQKSFYGNANITLVKRGPGTVKNSEGFAPLNGAKTAYNEARSFTGNYYPYRKFLFGGVKLQGGTLKLCQYYWVFGCDFQFDGNGVTLAAMKFDKNDSVDRGVHSLELQNGRIRETANVTDTTHRIYGEDARCWIHMFGDNMQDSAFSGKMDGAAGLIWDPTSSERSFTFSKTVSPSTGILVVSNGTVRVTDGAGFTALSSVVVDGATSVLAIDASAAGFAPSTPITLADGGKLELESGARVFLGSGKLVAGGVAVPDGVYSGTGEIGEQVSWIDGAGYVVVGPLAEGAAVAASWNGTGNASMLANWNGETELPPLTNGSAQITVAGGASFAADRDVWVKGFTLGPGAFALSALADKELWIGSAGIDDTANRALTVGASTGTVVVAASQTWNLGSSGTLAVAGDVGAIGTGTLTIKGTSANVVELNAASPSWTCPVVLTNVAVKFKATGALGPTSACAAYLYGSTAPAFAADITVKRDLWFGSAYTITGTADKTLVFDGFVCATNGQGLSVSSPAGSTITFNKLMMSRAGGMMSGAGTIVFHDSVHFRDRPSMQGTVTVELHKDGNRLNGNMGTFSGGRLKAMKAYVITKANTIRQANAGGGGSGDGGQNTMINSKDNFILDLNGFDQSIDQLAMHADGTSSGGHVTSASPAKLHVQTGSWWPSHNYSYGFGTSYKSISTADGYGYEASDKGYWEDRITLSYEAASGMVRSMMRTSSSSGNVEVVSGTLVFLRRAKTSGETFDLKGGSSNPYPRFASEDGAWPNATQVTVKGGTLKLEHGKVFGRQTDVYLDGGTLQLEEGVSQRVHALYLDGVKQRLGVWGSAASAAPTAHKHAYLGGTGLLNVTGDAQGSMLVIR